MTTICERILHLVYEVHLYKFTKLVLILTDLRSLLDDVVTLTQTQAITLN